MAQISAQYIAPSSEELSAETNSTQTMDYSPWHSDRNGVFGKKGYHRKGPRGPERYKFQLRITLQ